MGRSESKGSVYIYCDAVGSLYIDVFKNGERIDGEKVEKFEDVAWAVEKYTKKHGINEVFNGIPLGVSHILKKGGEYVHGYRPLSPEEFNRVFKALRQLEFAI
jgi:hypothetical protein